MYHNYSITLTIISCFIYRNINLLCDTLTKNVDNKIKMVSSLHAINSTIISYCFLQNIIPEIYYYNLLFLNSIGYFISDTVYLFMYRKTMSNGLFWQFIYHHIVCFICLNNLHIYPVLSAKGFLTEISTPFFNISWYLYKKNIKNLLYYINLSILYILFVKFRIIDLYCLYFSEYNTDLSSHSVMGVLIILNTIWLYKLSTIIITELYSNIWLILI